VPQLSTVKVLARRAQKRARSFSGPVAKGSEPQAASLLTAQHPSHRANLRRRATARQSNHSPSSRSFLWHSNKNPGRSIACQQAGCTLSVVREVKMETRIERRLLASVSRAECKDRVCSPLPRCRLAAYRPRNTFCHLGYGLKHQNPSVSRTRTDGGHGGLPRCASQVFCGIISSENSGGAGIRSFRTA
jgi:hypothetical protein